MGRQHEGWRVVLDGQPQAMCTTQEEAISRTADTTGLHPEFITEQWRKGRVVVDADGREWELVEVTSHENDYGGGPDWDTRDSEGGLVARPGYKLINVQQTLIREAVVEVTDAQYEAIKAGDEVARTEMLRQADFGDDLEWVCTDVLGPDDEELFDVV